MRVLFLLNWCLFPVLFAGETAKPERALHDSPNEFCVQTLLDPWLAYAEITPRLTDDERVRIGHSLLTELRWLGGKVATSPETSGQVAGAKFTFPSQLFFDGQRKEYDRTVAGLLALANVYSGHREGLLNPDTPAAIQISPETFEEMRARTLRVIHSPARLAAMQATLTVADLGKSEPFRAVMAGIGVRHDLDHDLLLAQGVTREPLVIESYSRLAPVERNLMLKTLTTDYNVAQFVQGENVPASIRALRGLTREEFEFFFLHFVYDVAGANGADDPRGAKALIDPVYKLFAKGADMLWAGLEANKSNEDIYDDFLEAYGAAFGWQPRRSLRERALCRLGLTSRATNAALAKTVEETFDALATVEKEILLRELAISGEGDIKATRLYYSPAIVANAVGYYKRRKDPEGYARALKDTFPVLARLHQTAFVAKRALEGNGVFTLDALEVSAAAGIDPEALRNKDFLDGPDHKVRVQDHQPTVDISQLKVLRSLAELPGKSFVFVGIGGGSDVIQAAQLASLAKAVGKEVRGLISIRRRRSSSQGPGGQQGVSWRLTGAVEEAPGVHQIFPQTRELNGARFLEHIPAAQFPVRLVFQEELDDDGYRWTHVAERLAHAIEGLAMPLDTVVLVDTGGDVLTKVPEAKSGQAPSAGDNQDAWSLMNAYVAQQSRLPGLRFVVAIVAPGIDAPADAMASLKPMAEAYAFRPADVMLMLSNYRHWKMDGDADTFDPARVGLTPLALQASLRERTGYWPLPVPARLVNDRRNPWVPHRAIDPSFRSVLFIDLLPALQAIGMVR